MAEPMIAARPEILEPDGFPLAPDSELNWAHRFLTSYLRGALRLLALGSVKPPEVAQWKDMLRATPQEKIGIINAAKERSLWHNQCVAMSDAVGDDLERSRQMRQLVDSFLIEFKKRVEAPGNAELECLLPNEYDDEQIYDWLMYSPDRKKFSPAVLEMLRIRYVTDSYHLKLHGLLGQTLGVVVSGYPDTKEIWGKQAAQDIATSEERTREAWHAFIEFLTEKEQKSPSQKWLKIVATHVEKIGVAEVESRISQWLTLYASKSEQVAPLNLEILRGLVWTASLFPKVSVMRAVAATVGPSLRKIPQERFYDYGGEELATWSETRARAATLASAAMWTLGHVDVGVPLLARLKTNVKDRTALRSIEKQLTEAAKRMGITAEDLEELAVADYGVTDGILKHEFGEARVEVDVSARRAIWAWYNETGKEVKSAPASVKRDYGAELKELKADIADLEKTFTAQKERLDALLRSEKTWPFAVWNERYLEHPLVQLLARRVIWTFEAKNGTRAVALPTELGFVDAQGKEMDVPTDGTVALWHPLFATSEEVLAWRRYFEENAIKQPFKQAHREIYLLTDAERNTNTYSNRFAAHIIKQHQFNSLCSARGWKNSLRLMVDSSYPPATKEWPRYGLRAEFWVEGVGDDPGTDTNETGTYLRLVTDQVRFYPIEAEQNWAQVGWGGYGAGQRHAPATPLPLEEVPPFVFSETMRDVDLFVGVSSIGADPTWQDGGPNGRYVNYWQGYAFGELSENAHSRADVLSRLLPRLKIREVASLDGRFLRVQGQLRTYKIHLGSGNILMEPNDQYLCIVPSRDPAEEVMLPFEGDRTLAVIISKAFMLAQDDKIKDPSIMGQITYV